MVGSCLHGTHEGRALNIRYAKTLVERIVEEEKEMIRLSRILGTILPLALLVAATEATGQDTLKVTADNPASWGDHPQLVEEARIGTLEGPEETSFGQVAGVGVMPDGTIWIGDNHLGAIRRFDTDGTYLGQVGRKGEGPGEFGYPSEIRVLPDGLVAVRDTGLKRVSLFEQTGEFLHSFRFPVQGYSALRVDMEGNLYLFGATSVFTREEAEKLANAIRSSEREGQSGALRLLADNTQAEGETRRLFWLRMSPEGEITDTLFRPELPEDDFWGVWSRVGFNPKGYFAIAVGKTDRYEITYRRPDSTVVLIERPIEPIRWEPEERREQERLEQIFSSRGGASGEVTEFKPPFNDLWIDQESRFWVTVRAPGIREETPGEAHRRERYDGPVQEWREPFVTEVFEADGTYLGTVRFPNRQTELEAARGTTVWVVEKGPWDEDYVVRYRIESGGQG